MSGNHELFLINILFLQTEAYSHRNVPYLFTTSEYLYNTTSEKLSEIFVSGNKPLQPVRLAMNIYVCIFHIYHIHSELQAELSSAVCWEN